VLRLRPRLSEHPLVSLLSPHLVIVLHAPRLVVLRLLNSQDFMLGYAAHRMLQKTRTLICGSLKYSKHQS